MSRILSQMYVYYNLGTVLGDEEQARPCTACPPGTGAGNLGPGTEAASSARPSRSVASCDCHNPASGPEWGRKTVHLIKTPFQPRPGAGSSSMSVRR